MGQISLVDICICLEYTYLVKILPEPISFDWDKGNINKNLKKHNVTNQEAEETFSNEPFIVSEDIKHSQKEKRFQALGKTNKAKLLFISFTVRNDKVRIISARNMSKKERREYEKALKAYTDF